MKKGRHRRFEEARKLKQSGPDFLFSDDGRRSPDDTDTEVGDDDEYAALARKLKQSGPDFLFSDDGRRSPDDTDTDTEVGDDDEYAALARKYGALDDDTTDDDE